MRVCQSIEELTQLAFEHKDCMSPRGMSAYWTLVSKLLHKRNKPSNQMQIQIDELIGQTLRNCETYNYKDLATIAISLAKIISRAQQRKSPHYGSLEQIIQDVLIGKDSMSKEHIFTEIASASVSILRKFPPRELSNLIYSYGLAEYVITEDGITLFDVFAQAAIPNLSTFNGQDLSNMLWSYANVGVSNSHLFEQAGDSIVAMNNLNEFKPQDCSNIVWAYATLDEHNPQLFEKFASHIVRLDNLDQFWPQALSNILWAYATANEKHPKLFKKVADHKVGLGSLNKFEPQHLSNTIWAFATSGESNPQLFNKLAEEAIKRQHEFKPQEIANFLWSHATNGQVDEHLFSSLVPSVKENLNYNTQNLANVAWAYSVADVDASSIFNNEFINACLSKEDSFELEELRQLHQWQLWQDEIKSDISLPSSLQKRCYEAFISVKPSSSRFQDDVISMLSFMGLQPQDEVLLKSGYRIDAAVEVNGRQISVEVDGPSHFIGRSRELAGSTILKHRQVASLDGIQVVSVPYWEWGNLKKDSRKKQYLQQFLGI